MRPTQVLAAALAFSSLSSAWLDILGQSKAIAAPEGMLYRRDDSSTAASSASAKSTPQQSASATQTASDDNNSKSSAASGSGSVTSASGKATGTNSASGSGAKATTTKSKVYTNAAAGGVSMITPAATAGAQYYKIGDWVTLAWNYTSLSVTPSAVDVLATCTKNNAYYTLAVNMSTNGEQKLLWDTNSYKANPTQPLVMDTYTLVIYDADSSVSAAARGGYLGVDKSFQFAMYSPSPYVAWADYKCPTCSSAGSMLSAAERQTLGFLFIMSTITVLSFTWFASGFGLF